MPPSPSLRRSPRGGSPSDSHKRGRSLERGLSFKERDDDLALFNEMQSRETENFLLKSTDEFEDIFSSRAKPFPDLKLGINIPARGESSDLLNAHGDKNDYDWLLTPPDTPLFPSLDDEPVPVNLVRSSRARSQPISISRSSTIEKSQRSSRGSPSPQRLSPSPRSTNSTFRGRPSSAPHSSPVPLRPSTPSRRPSPPAVKPSTPPPRSLTPTPRRTTAGSVVTSGMRGTSPVRTSRGNSASPKIRAWQSNIPGFSLEAPPNLRTSLADRPASYVRGSSPASRASRDSSSKFGRQSMSPTASRSISSSHSQERDRLSSHSKGSFASSGDDDADSLQSFPMSVSERPMSRKGVGGSPSGRPLAFSKKPTKTFSPNSAPKRSFDSAMRQMDRRSPQNMFRPLLSSVPSSTFYAGKASSANRSLISRNSSVTTSTSSDIATSGALDSDQYQDDMTSEYTRAPFSDAQDEVFAFDKTDVANEDAGREVHDAEVQLGELDKGLAFASNPGQSRESDFRIRAMESGAVDVPGDLVKIGSHENTLVCSRCGIEYYPDKQAETEDCICPECKQKEELLSNSETTRNVSVPLTNISQESHVGQPTLSVGDADSRDTPQFAMHEERTLKAEDHASQPKQSFPDNSLPVSVGEEGFQKIPEHRITGEPRMDIDPSGTREMQKCSDITNQNISVTEGAGISVVLLNRSSSGKGPLIHGRTINSSATSFNDLSYARDLSSSMRSSIGHGSVSASSSIDFTSTRNGEIAVRRQLSGTGSSLSGTSMQVYQCFGRATSSREESCEGSVSNTQYIVSGERPGSPSEQVLALGNMESLDAVPSVSRVTIPAEDNNDISMSSREKDPSFMVNHMVSTELEDKSRASVGVDEGYVLDETDEDPLKRIGNIENADQSVLIESSLTEESTVPDNRVNQVEATEDSVECSLSTMSEIEINDSHPSSPRSQIDMVSKEELEDPSAAVHCHKDVKGLSMESTESNHADGIVEESTVTVEDQGGRRTRSMTLEEATDTILFCSSIIHDLVYKAASIAIEKEKENLEPLEGSRPTVTIPEKWSSYRRDPRGISTGRSAKTQKARKKCAETPPEAKPPLTQHEEKSNEPEVRNVGLPNNGDSMKPPKLESKCNCAIM